MRNIYMYIDEQENESIEPRVKISTLVDLGRERGLLDNIYPDAETLKGRPVSPGVVEGRATVITDPKDFNKIGDHTILVCPHAWPELSMIYPHIKGLVADQGGILTPAAISAREHHIPAVFGLSDATMRIESGDIIRVEGDVGIIKILSKAH
ncbi:PEP-utilizing enzyme [Thermodesulfobacteriota bacterium]